SISALGFFFVAFFLCCAGYNRYLHSFPTRRSSDLLQLLVGLELEVLDDPQEVAREVAAGEVGALVDLRQVAEDRAVGDRQLDLRSEEHTSELQSRENLVCRLLLEKKKNEITRSMLA